MALLASIINSTWGNDLLTCIKSSSLRQTISKRRKHRRTPCDLVLQRRYTVPMSGSLKIRYTNEQHPNGQVTASSSSHQLMIGQVQVYTTPSKQQQPVIEQEDNNSQVTESSSLQRSTKYRRIQHPTYSSNHMDTHINNYIYNHILNPKPR